MKGTIGKFATSLTGVALIFGLASAQSTQKISLAEAIKLARKRNGNILAAEQNIKASRAAVDIAFSNFLPDITPSYTYSDSRREIADTQFGTQGLSFIQNSSQIKSSLTVFDLGQRGASYRVQQKNYSATQATSLQTVRQTLFDVQQQYLETLRAQELQKVADAQVERTNLVLKQTEARVQVGDAAKREILQATADALNATVTSITSRNRTFTNAAGLKALIGLPKEEALPTLEPVPLDLPKTELESLAIYLEEGIANRPDLQAQRKRVESSRESERLAVLNQGFNVTGSLTYDLQITPERLANRSYSLNVSYPLFDGYQARYTVSQAKASLEAGRQQLVQSERNARSEIESAYLTFTQNMKRREAAQLAVNAARLNYEATVGSQKVGASDLVQVLTAQVSLVTSETNLIEATYDTLISELRLKLVSGRPIPGQ